MGERLGGVGHDGWEMRHVLLACEMLLDGQNYLVGASAHMIPGAVGQHRIFVDTSADFSRFKPATTELVVL